MSDKPQPTSEHLQTLRRMMDEKQRGAAFMAEYEHRDGTVGQQVWTDFALEAAALTKALRLMETASTVADEMTVAFDAFTEGRSEGVTAADLLAWANRLRGGDSNG